jgi:membrane protein YdbS with pleckstrin-like domain
MYCHRCGNQIPAGSQFCNRCGAQINTTADRLRKPSIKAAPPRPARRHPILDSRPAPKPVEEEETEIAEQTAEARIPARRAGTQTVPGNKAPDGVIFRINQAFYPALVAYFGSTMASLAVVGVIIGLKLPVPLWVIPILVILIYIPAIIRHIRLRTTIFILTPTKLEIESGFFSKSSRNIPLRHVQDVFVSETFKERLIGIGDIIIDTAATEGKISLDNISEPRMYADMILDQLHGWD